MLQDLQTYTSLAIKLIKEFAAHKKISLKIFRSEELIADCVARLVKSDQDYGKRPSKLDLNQYRRMNTWYTIRTFLHRMKNRRTITYPFLSSNEYDQNTSDFFCETIYQDSPLKTLEIEEENNIKLTEIKQSNLRHKEKKYISELINGKMLKEIVRENKTVGPSVKKIVKEGVSKLKAERLN
jgi:hypothetical protein